MGRAVIPCSRAAARGRPSGRGDSGRSPLARAARAAKGARQGVARAAAWGGKGGGKGWQGRRQAWGWSAAEGIAARGGKVSEWVVGGREGVSEGMGWDCKDYRRGVRPPRTSGNYGRKGGRRRELPAGLCLPPARISRKAPKGSENGVEKEPCREPLTGTYPSTVKVKRRSGTNRDQLFPDFRARERATRARDARGMERFFALGRKAARKRAKDGLRREQSAWR